MRTKLFHPTYPNSFLTMAFGSQFYALDLAGLTSQPFAVGIRVTRTNSGPGTFDLDTFRIDSHAPPEKRVKVYRVALTWTGSEFMRSAHIKLVPPGPSGHYPGELPPWFTSLTVPTSAQGRVISCFDSQPDV